jgi:hypothetical protein
MPSPAKTSCDILGADRHDYAGTHKGLRQQMTTRITMGRIAAAALGAMLSGALLPVTGFAQQTDKPVGTATSNQIAGAKSVKPVQRSAAKQNSRKTEAQGQQWSLENALPDSSAAIPQYEPPPPPQIGRVPLRTGPGTVGFESDRRINPYQTPDGAIIRGQDAAAGRSSSYVGLSLSVPTSDKALNIPVPWGRP